MTDAARLLREIAANPAADVLRLAFADAIEERDGPGDEAWAVFVRVQVWASQCEVCHGERTLPSRGPASRHARDSGCS